LYKLLTIRKMSSMISGTLVWIKIDSKEIIYALFISIFDKDTPI